MLYSKEDWKTDLYTVEDSFTEIMKGYDDYHLPTYPGVISTSGISTFSRIPEFKTPISEDFSMLPCENGIVVVCNNINLLSEHRILSTVSKMKNLLVDRLTLLSPTFDHIECITTPETYDNLMNACNKLKMYGKSKPMIACFDENFNRLPDQIKTLRGVDIVLYNSCDYENGLHLEFKGLFTF